MTPTEESKLVKGVLENDKHSFSELVRRYEKLIVHIIFPLVKDKEDRSDLLQEIFIRIYQNLGNFNYRSKLSTWIGNIAYNTALNFVKKRRINTVSSSDLEATLHPPELELNPEQQFISVELEEKVNKAVARLPAIQEVIIRLFHNDEMSLEEISHVVNLPINTVKSHLFRGRQNIKTLIFST